jgi:hypothetical protein
MAVEGPYDGDAASDSFRPSDRIGHERVERMVAGLELADPEWIDREENYWELRASDTAELRPSVSGAGDAPERTDEGGWKWKGLELDPTANRVADLAIEARREAEGRDAEGNYAKAGITPDMRRIEGELEHGTLVPDTERFALKSPDRFKEKLAKLILDEPDMSPAEHCQAIHDGIRYTMLFDGDSYTSGVGMACEQLRSHGYELMVLKNTWDNAEYKGINSRWLDRESDILFEVQFHTLESWSAKQLTHDVYEKINDLTTSTLERERLRDYQRGVSGQLEEPADCRGIEDYRREGW